MSKLTTVAIAWPFAVSLAAFVTARGVVVGKRRSSLNEALHELRRPLQAIALAAGQEPAERRRLESSVQLAAVALERLDCEINGERCRERRDLVAMRSLVESAVLRWRARASLAGDSLALSWSAGHAVVRGDRFGLAQALDNLIVNAIEHGGDSIEIDAQRRGNRLRVTVADSGAVGHFKPLHEARAEAIDRLLGRNRRGHGLAVVRRIAAAHRGRFVLRRSARGSLAALELPLAGTSGELAA